MSLPVRSQSTITNDDMGNENGFIAIVEHFESCCVSLLKPEIRIYIFIYKILPIIYFLHYSSSFLNVINTCKVDNYLSLTSHTCAFHFQMTIRPRNTGWNRTPSKPPTRRFATIRNSNSLWASEAESSCSSTVIVWPTTASVRKGARPSSAGIAEFI